MGRKKEVRSDEERKLKEIEKDEPCLLGAVYRSARSDLNKVQGWDLFEST